MGFCSKTILQKKAVLAQARGAHFCELFTRMPYRRAAWRCQSRRASVLMCFSSSLHLT